jgi:uncharacterized RDD family membrane protein YckC
MAEYHGRSFNPPGIFCRFLAFFIDFVMIFGMIGMMILLYLILEITSLAMDMQADPHYVLAHTLDTIFLSLEPGLQHPIGLTAPDLFLILVKWFFLIMIPVYGLYSAGYEGSAQQGTPGKTAMHIIVTDREGRSVGVCRSFLRTVGKIFCIIPCGLGFLPVLISKKGYGLHDHLAGTQVVMGVPDSSPDRKALGRADAIFIAILSTLLGMMWLMTYYSLFV